MEDKEQIGGGGIKIPGGINHTNGDATTAVEPEQPEQSGLRMGPMNFTTGDADASESTKETE